jgi:hypothetical protein
MRSLLVASTIALLILPTATMAQESALHAQIRADLMQDPRSAELSQTELDALVNALATEAEETGTASEYLNGQTSFDYSDAFAAQPQTSTSPILPIALAVLALAIVLGSVIVYLVRTRGTRVETPSDIAA